MYIGRHFIVATISLFCLIFLLMLGSGCNISFDPLHGMNTRSLNGMLTNVAEALTEASRHNSGLYADFAEPFYGKPISFDKFADFLQVTPRENLSEFLAGQPSNPWNPNVPIVVIDSHDADGPEDDIVAMDQKNDKNLSATIMYETDSLEHHFRITYWIGGDSIDCAHFIYDSEEGKSSFQ